MPDRGGERDAAEAFVGLGANVGDRLGALRGAVRAIGTWPGTAVVAASAVYESEAHVLPGTPPQPDHLNAVVQIRTALAPDEVLERLHAAERAAGRDPGAPAWSPRRLDLDLLLWGDLVLDTPPLTVPHPRLADRRFVLRPLADLAPQRLVPGRGGAVRTVTDLLRVTLDTARLERTDHVLLPVATSGL